MFLVSAQIMCSCLSFVSVLHAENICSYGSVKPIRKKGGEVYHRQLFLSVSCIVFSFVAISHGCQFECSTTGSVTEAMEGDVRPAKRLRVTEGMESTVAVELLLSH